MSDDVLARIVAETRRALAAAPAVEGLERAAVERMRGRSARSLRATLMVPGVRVVAECKRRSPSAGELSADLVPGVQARAYEEGGAAAVSVVTEPAFFGGRLEWLDSVRSAVELPVLRKDFLLEPRQLAESAVAGADAVLLIARILEGGLLAEMHAAARELGLETLVEVHDPDELDRALDAGAEIVGVNARNLRTFSVDLDAAATLALEVPPDRVAVVESGVNGPADVRRLGNRGIRRFLVGGHLVRSADPAAAVRELVG